MDTFWGTFGLLHLAVLLDSFLRDALQRYQTHLPQLPQCHLRLQTDVRPFTNKNLEILDILENLENLIIPNEGCKTHGIMSSDTPHRHGKSTQSHI
ncbi:hypothetical protein KOW79_020927 [Hemibagrus wyckioides]|uniref:Secreted protein n=1 Tax=Hemibagrus wyckioides TaxID=337641 RepID=A0A9D3N3R8_9TELE|nr:hypothetical protein KOW79_020927 [Hemibagrus wyckioides]